MGRVLSRRVVVVDVVGDSDSALVRLELDEIDVVVTDYDLGPDPRNGVELALAIRQRWPWIPVIMVSGSVDACIRARAREAGIRVCLEKPVSYDALFDALREATTGDDVGHPARVTSRAGTAPLS